MDEVADRLDPRPARRRLAEQLPGDVGQPIGLAIAAAEQKDQRLLGQILDRDAARPRARPHRAGRCRRTDAVGRQPHAAGGRDDPAAPVAEAVAIGRDRHGGIGGQVIRHDDVGRPREMRAEHRDHRRCLRKVVDHLEADTNFHARGLALTALWGMVRRSKSCRYEFRPVGGAATIEPARSSLSQMATKSTDYNAKRGLLASASPIPRKRWLIVSGERTVHLMPSNQAGPELSTERVLP